MGAAPASKVRGLTDPAQAAAQYAAALQEDLQREFGLRLHDVSLPEEHPAEAWARSGLMSLTGEPQGEPLMCPVALASYADATLAVLAQLAGSSVDGLSGSSLLAVRAAIAGHTRQGRASPGGSCRLLEAAGGRLALNLARDDDWGLLPAWLEGDCDNDWNAVASAVRTRDVDELVARGRSMGMAVADSRMSANGGGWFTIEARGPVGQAPSRPPRVVDLSSLWAGPLCGQLLSRCGAEVIKVESAARPDGARNGPRPFFDLLNAGKACVSVDLQQASGIDQLRALIETADIVIEGSRPRALRQLGIDADALINSRPGLTWVSITGYGRRGDEADWVAFGDDAGVAAGLSEVMAVASGRPLVVGDAIADPLSGLHAAIVAWASWSAGGGRLVSLAMRDVVRHCINFDVPAAGTWAARQAEWTDAVGEVVRPAAIPVVGIARPLGADNDLIAG